MSDEIGALWGERLASWLNRRHPLVYALVGSLFFAISGGVAAAFVGLMLKAEASELPFVAAGAVFGVFGAVAWAYAFVMSFAVPVSVGRAIFVLTLAVAAAAFGAVLLRPPLQVLCAAVVAARLLPQSVFAIVQGLQDVRDPEGRKARVERAMTMAQRK